VEVFGWWVTARSSLTSSKYQVLQTRPLTTHSHMPPIDTLGLIQMVGGFLLNFQPTHQPFTVF